MIRRIPFPTTYSTTTKRTSTTCIAIDIDIDIVIAIPIIWFSSVSYISYTYIWRK